MHRYTTDMVSIYVVHNVVHHVVTQNVCMWHTFCLLSSWPYIVHLFGVCNSQLITIIWCRYTTDMRTYTTLWFRLDSPWRRGIETARHSICVSQLRCVFQSQTEGTSMVVVGSSYGFAQEPFRYLGILVVHFCKCVVDSSNIKSECICSAVVAVRKKKQMIIKKLGLWRCVFILNYASSPEHNVCTNVVQICTTRYPTLQICTTLYTPQMYLSVWDWHTRRHIRRRDSISAPRYIHHIVCAYNAVFRGMWCTSMWCRYIFQFETHMEEGLDIYIILYTPHSTRIECGILRYVVQMYVVHKCVTLWVRDTRTQSTCWVRTFYLLRDTY